MPVTPVTIPSAGIWLVNYVIRLASAGAVITRFLTSIITSNVGLPINVGLLENGATQNINSSQAASNGGSAVLIVPNSTSTITIQVVLAITSGTLTSDGNSYIQLTRIG